MPERRTFRRRKRPLPEAEESVSADPVAPVAPPVAPAHPQTAPDSADPDEDAAAPVPADEVTREGSDSHAPPSPPDLPESAPEPLAPENLPAPAPPEESADGDAWDRLATMTLDERHLDAHRVITASRLDTAHTSFDVLRTRVLQAMADRGWTRLAITSASQGCGKTFTTANLAISLSRQTNCRAVVLDLDLRRPSLHKVLGRRPTAPLGDMLRGRIAPEDHLERLGESGFAAGQNIAFGLNDTPETYASELLQDPRSVATFARIEEMLAPRLMLFDLPPALHSDDVIALRPHFDAVLLVVGGGLTTEAEIREVENRLGPETPLLGVVLNRAEGAASDRYSYY